jgi:hypothetical protein
MLPAVMKDAKPATQGIGIPDSPYLTLEEGARYCRFDDYARPVVSFRQWLRRNGVPAAAARSSSAGRAADARSGDAGRAVRGARRYLRGRTSTMRVFQRTSRDTAADIRIMGFYDASDALGAGAQRMGVWVTNQPIDASDDAVATLVTLRIPITLFERHEHRHGYNGHRDAMIPADDLNACGQAHIVSAGAEARWMNLRARLTRKDA